MHKFKYFLTVQKNIFQLLENIHSILSFKINYFFFVIVSSYFTFVFFFFTKSLLLEMFDNTKKIVIYCFIKRKSYIFVLKYLFSPNCFPKFWRGEHNQKIYLYQPFYTFY